MTTTTIRAQINAAILAVGDDDDEWPEAIVGAVMGVIQAGSREHPFIGEPGQPCEVCGYTVTAKYVPAPQLIHPEGSSS